MVFKAMTLDLTEDINTTFPYTLPSSPESTICLPLGHSCTRPIVARVAAGVSQLFTAPRLDPAYQQKKKNRELPCIASACIDLQFPDQKQLRSFTYGELKKATDSFSEKNVVGEGGFSIVYQGRLPSGYLVAVKRFKQKSCQEEFRAEVQVGKMVMHQNVVPLIGFCEAKKPKERLLVYPFKGKGDLWSHLYERPRSQLTLDWETRKRIALGIAWGLSYLHDYCFFRIIHRDIKPGNILLDENLEPHIADFGLARFMDHKMQVGLSTLTPDHVDGIREESQMEYHSAEHLDDISEHKTNRVCGTYGYAAPEYIREGKYSQKTDVFSYGITLLELVSGCNFNELLSLANRERIGYPLDLVKRLVDAEKLEGIIDKCMGDNYSKTEAKRLIKLSLICTQFLSPSKRPSMSEVVGILKGSNGSLDTRWGEFQQNWVEEIKVRSAFNQQICSSSGTGFA